MVVNSLRTLATSVALLLGAAAQAGPCTSLGPARWLLGSWVADGGKRVITETWTEASPATFEGQGVTRERTDGSVVDGEALRLDHEHVAGLCAGCRPRSGCSAATSPSAT